MQWCIKDRSFFAFARRKQKRQARKGEREYFHQLPDPKKDLYLRLRMGQQAVVLGLVPKAGEDVQRALCKLGRRTYHITYALRHEADVEASDNSAQQQQAHSSTDTKQFSPTSSLRPVSRSSSSTKQSSGSWLQNLMSPNKRNKREHNEDEHPAKKRALTAWFMRLSKPRYWDPYMSCWLACCPPETRAHMSALVHGLLVPVGASAAHAVYISDDNDNCVAFGKPGCAANVLFLEGMPCCQGME
eukprot:scaffold164750_cov18-Tisochrysis_lutea.AAC.1